MEDIFRYIVAKTFKQSSMEQLIEAKGGRKMENEKEELEIDETSEQIECAFCGMAYNEDELDEDGNCPNCVDTDEQDSEEEEDED